MKDVYENPLITRYASREMARNFSDDKKFRIWRGLWIALAEAELELGLPVTQEQVDELKAHADDINYEEAEKREREVRHDVMAHVHAYGLQCPKAKPIIHLGATSCYVGDNADLVVIRDAFGIIEKKLAAALSRLRRFAHAHRELPALGYTHFQPAQLVTVGKRACLWMYDLLMDLEELRHVKSGMKLRGVKGTTGTQASFLTLCNGDHEKVKRLEQAVVRKMGFSGAYAVTGQTYPRKEDSRFLNVLSLVAQSAYKFGNDLRLLQHMKEVEEPFEENQIGSSAMAYKRNPMRSERMTALCRYLLSLPANTAVTAATQWFERTLDDSANRRLVLPQAFLAADAVMNLYLNIASGLSVRPRVIQKHIEEELPFMATETILMEAVKRGGDRQELHERIRLHAMAAAARVKDEGLPNNLLELIEKDPAFGLSKDALLGIVQAPRFTGRSAQQVEEFIRDHVDPCLKRYEGQLDMEDGVHV